MELLKVTGFVLKCKDYGERDRLVTLLTPSDGKILVNAKGVNKITSKLSGATAVHTLGRYELNFSKERFLLSGFEKIDHFSDISSDIDKHYVSEILLETADFLSIENNSDELFFIYLIKTFGVLCYKNVDPKVLLVKFLTDTLRNNGFDLNYSNVCCRCSSKKIAYFSYSCLAFLCKNCASTNDVVATLTGAETSFLEKVYSSDYDNLEGLTIGGNEFVGVMRHLYILLSNLLKFKSRAITEYMKLFKSSV